jgi:hypothetical protein
MAVSAFSATSTRHFQTTRIVVAVGLVDAGLAFPAWIETRPDDPFDETMSPRL